MRLFYKMYSVSFGNSNRKTNLKYVRLSVRYFNTDQILEGLTFEGICRGISFFKEKL